MENREKRIKIIVCSFTFNINNQTYLVGMFLAACAFPLEGAALCQVSISIYF